MAGGTSEVLTDGLSDFIEEVSPMVAEAEQTILSWATAEGSVADSVNSLFRSFHNIKGTSGMFGLSQLQEVFHNAENLLGVFRERGTKPSEDACTGLLATLDEFKRITAHALENAAEPADKPYMLMHQLVESRKAALSSDAAGDGGAAEGDGAKAKKGNADESIRITAQHANELVEIVSDYIQLQNRMEVSLGADSSASAVRNDIRRFSSRLQGFVLAIRLSPIHPLLSGLQRTAASAAREVGKRFRMQISGGDTQLDRRVIEMLRDPLIHMIRNSIDHGLEKPEDRASANKNADGLIAFEAFQQAGQVVLSLSDDGKGMDPKRIKSKALAKGFITEDDASRMSDKEIVRLVLLPGFSTADTVTSLSGRGVGMDAVKTTIESMGGTVDIDSQLGRGTKITLTLPLTLAIVKSLAFRVGGQHYAVPQTAVEEVITSETAYAKDRVSMVEGKGKMLHMRHAVIPVISLRDILGSREVSRETIFIVIRNRNVRFALEADTIVGPRDFVSQPLPVVHSNVEIISGVNQLNSGDYISLLDLAAFGKMLEPTGEAVNADPFAIKGDEAPNVSEVFRSQQKLVFFKSGKHLAVPVQAIRQVVRVKGEWVDAVGDKTFLTFEGKTYPVLRLHHHFGPQTLDKHVEYTAMIVAREGHVAAILCEEFNGIHRLPKEFEMLISAPGIQGSVNHEGRTYLVTNVHAVFALEFPDAFRPVIKNSGKFHVLIAEDDPFFASYLSDFLHQKGFRVSVGRDGIEAKEFLENSVREGNEADNVDYLITDLEMPRMNGLDLLGFIRQHAQLSSLPVTLCTAVGDDTARRTAHKLGVDFYSGKMKYEDILPHIIRRQRGSEIGLDAETITSKASSDAANEELAEANRRVLAFMVGGRNYGIEIDCLKEISAASVPTPVPGRPEAASNIVGFRGHPIPVLDLRTMSGARANGVDIKDAEQIVAKFGNHLCALWVDKVLNVRRAQKLDRASGLIRSEDSQGSHIAALVGDMLWGEDQALSLIDARKIERLISFIQTKAPNFNPSARRSA